MSAIQSLPLTHRQTIVLALEGLSHAEIVEVMGITENNVAVRLTRIRKALKDALGRAAISVAEGNVVLENVLRKLFQLRTKLKHDPELPRHLVAKVA